MHEPETHSSRTPFSNLNNFPSAKARSVAADIYSGKELASMLAVIGAINGVAPVAAPVGGGLVCTIAAGESPRFYLKKTLLIGRQ